jgi:hypothetical protein
MLFRCTICKKYGHLNFNCSQKYVNNGDMIEEVKEKPKVFYKISVEAVSSPLMTKGKGR